MASLRVASARSLRSSPPPAMRFLGFFAANIRNTHTRRAYARAADEFVAWCANVACLRSMPSIRCRRHLDRGRHARPRGAERQAKARSDPSSVRLAGDRPGRAGSRRAPPAAPSSTAAGGPRVRIPLPPPVRPVRTYFLESGRAWFGQMRRHKRCRLILGWFSCRRVILQPGASDASRRRRSQACRNRVTPS
jgi:hypothetical protein